MLLQIKQWECKYLRDFSAVKNGEITEGQLYTKLIAMYYDFVSANNIEPFTISYGRGYGFCINANSHIGVIVNDDIALYITSMVPDLTLGKILYLQSQGQNDNNTTTKQVLTDHLNDEESINAIDYFIVSLVDIFEDIKQNGLLTELVSVNEENNKIIGRLSVPKQVAKHPAYDKFCVEKVKSSTDILINQIIRSALEKAKTLTALQWLIPIISDAIDFISDVTKIDDLESIDFPNVSDYTSIKRDDYDKALRFSKYILFGFDPLEGESSEYFPEFILDMNAVFENYVNIGLKRIFKSGYENKKIFSLGLGPIDIPIERKNIELDGYYNDGSKRVVLDTKNKYKSVLDKDAPDFIANNPDIYQQYYYASRIDAKHIILVYPSSKKRTAPIGAYDLNFPNNKDVKMYFWALHISGTPKENKKALINLAQFIDSL